MATAIVQQAWHEIRAISGQIEGPRLKLVELQMTLLEGFDNGIVNHMSDLMTDGIDSIIREPSKDLAIELSSFVKGLLFMAKGKYLSAVKKHKKTVGDLLVETASIFINNIEAIVESVITIKTDFLLGIRRTLSALRDLFFNNTEWIKKLLSFFLSKVDVATAREEYLGFVEKVLQKASRYSFLMGSSILYRELAHDLDRDLTQRYAAKLDNEYPSAKLPKKASILFLILMDLVFGSLIIACLLIGEIIGFVFCMSSTILISLWLVRIIFSLKKRDDMKLDLVEKYNSWLRSIQESSNEIWANNDISVS